MLQTVMTTTPTPPNIQPSSSNGQLIASSAKQLFKPTNLTYVGWKWISLEGLKNKKVILIFVVNSLLEELLGSNNIKWDKKDI
jgi:hypothetical protein